MRNRNSVFDRPGSIVALLAGILLFPGASLAAGETTADLERIFNGFYNLSLDTGTAYAAKGFRLQKDAMTFEFETGHFLLAEPLEGEILCAYFVGEGKARMTPPVAMEREQLARRTGSENLEMRFTEMYLSFSDGTGAKLQALPQADPAGLATTRARAHLSERIGKVRGASFLDLELDYLESRISNLRDRDFFLAQFLTGDSGWLAFTFNQQDRMEVYLGGERTLGVTGRWEKLPWTAFHQTKDYDEAGHYVANLGEDAKDILDISHHRLRVNVRNLKEVELTAELRLTARVDGLRALRFDLINNLDPFDWERDYLPARVQSVTDAGGSPLPYIHKRHELLVLLPEPLTAGQEYALTVEVHEQTIQQLTRESFSLLNTYPWFPQYGYLGGRATLDWEVRVPKPYQATGSGRLVREWEEGDANCSQWKSDVPVVFPSLLFGRFQRESDVFQSNLTQQKVMLNVHAFPLVTLAITDPLELALLGLSSPQNIELRVPTTKMGDMLEESKSLLTLYEDIYGPVAYNEIDIAQMGPQLTFGQAPPGLLQLWGIAFLSRAHPLVQNDPTAANFIRDLLAHEMAHQWWGNAVGWFEDEDVWLSESFAEYSAGIWIQARHGERDFQDKLKVWRQAAKVADGVSPIAAATRVSGDTEERDRIFLLYDKGPLVVHMLRTMVGDENYKTAMRAFTERYRHQNVKTEHLQREFEKVVGYSLDWFFDQWFRDTGIASIRFRYEVKPTEDGKYLFTGHFRQDPAGFKRFLGLPITFQFGKDQMAVQKVMIKGPEETVQLKLPLEPKKVIVDEGNALLADIIYEKPGSGS